MTCHLIFRIDGIIDTEVNIWSFVKTCIFSCLSVKINSRSTLNWTTATNASWTVSKMVHWSVPNLSNGWRANGRIRFGKSPSLYLKISIFSGRFQPFNGRVNDVWQSMWNSRKLLTTCRSVLMKNCGVLLWRVMMLFVLCGNFSDLFLFIQFSFSNGGISEAKGCFVRMVLGADRAGNNTYGVSFLFFYKFWSYDFCKAQTIKHMFRLLKSSVWYKLIFLMTSICVSMEWAFQQLYGFYWFRFNILYDI